MSSSHSKFFVFFLLISFFSTFSPLTHKASGQSTTIKIPSNTPRTTVLGAEFVLVNDVQLPEKLARLRTRWDEILQNHKYDIFTPANIPLTKMHKGQWVALSKITAKSPRSLKTLRNINGFFNSISSQQDKDFYGKNEYWATPEEFMRNKRGDCEDYAIAKYFALQHFTWPKKDLWVVFLHDKVNVGGHAILLAKIDDKRFVLDNLSQPNYLLIPAVQYEKQVDPFAMGNHQGLWLRVSDKKRADTVSKSKPK